MTSSKIIVKAVCALALAGTLVGAFFLGRSRGQTGGRGLRAEVEKLRKSEADAAIVTRVSQQMEEIAYQQKVISDLQRDRAEQQSELAMRMRDRAEHEKVLARQAEEHAVKSAREASEQRQKAIEQQILAEEQRDQADLARRISDTLSYKALGRTLGYSALVRQESGETELAGLLAYASWHFLDKYRGNTYQTESFRALVSCSGMLRGYSLKKSGGVNGMCTYADGYAVVSDFGELEIHLSDGSLVSIPVQNPDYDFRAVLSREKTIYALSARGPLVLCRDGLHIREVELPVDIYHCLCETEEGSLLAVGRHTIVYFDESVTAVKNSVSLEEEISTAIGTERGTILFLSSGKWKISDSSGNIREIKSSVSDPVTAASYDRDARRLFLGHKNGAIDMYSAGSDQVVTLLGHVGKVLDLAFCGDVLVSSSYDKSVMVWNLEELGESARESKLTPAELQLSNGWPLCLMRIDENTVAAGCSDGQVFHTSISASQMAAAVLRKTDRNLTEEEWQNHIGYSVPYETFKQ